MNSLSSTQFRKTHTILLEAPIVLNASTSQGTHPMSNALPARVGDIIDLNGNGTADVSMSRRDVYMQGKLEGHTVRNVTTGQTKEPVFTGGYDGVLQMAKDAHTEVLTQGMAKIPLNYMALKYGSLSPDAPAKEPQLSAWRHSSLDEFTAEQTGNIPGDRLAWAIDTVTRSFLVYVKTP